MENYIQVLQSRTCWFGLQRKIPPFSIQEIQAERSNPQTHPLVLATVSFIFYILCFACFVAYSVVLLHSFPFTELILGTFLTSRSHPVDNAGFLSFTTFAWMTPMMWAMFRNKVDISSLNLSPFDIADTSGERSDPLYADSWMPHIPLLSFDPITVYL